jgi:hypothetical protein
MRKLILAAALLVFAAPVEARTILFIGNSFTFGANSAARRYHTETVTDLNGPAANGKTDGGVAAIFKAFTVQAGLDYTVSIETVGGKGMDYHVTEKRAVIDKPWDDVVMHGYSTLDQAKPGDPALLASSARQIAALLRARNPNVKLHLMATWSRADQVYPANATVWKGKPVQQMGKDIHAAYLAAAKAANITDVIPVGLAWNRAIDTGAAGADPYAGIPAGKINLWAWDSYHASAYGYYLEALMDFGRITGKDPLSLGDNETVAEDFGFSRPQTHALQQIAHDELAAQGGNN